MQAALILLALATAAEGPRDRDAAGAWAIGYAAAVERACPGWRRVPARRGVLRGEGKITAWGFGGPLAAMFWRGMSAAERRRADARFCAAPASFPDSALVGRILEPVAGTTPPAND